MHRFIVGLVLAVMSTPASGATVDYLHHMDQFRIGVTMVTSGRSCEHFGLIVDDEGVHQFVMDARLEAIKDGMSPDAATAIFVSELKDEMARLQEISDHTMSMMDGPQTVSALKKHIDFWGERCRDLMNDPMTRRYFHH